MQPQKASHIRLVKGIVRVNPHVRVLCPTVAKDIKFKKTGNTAIKFVSSNDT